MRKSSLSLSLAPSMRFTDHMPPKKERDVYLIWTFMVGGEVGQSRRDEYNDYLLSNPRVYN